MSKRDKKAKEVRMENKNWLSKIVVVVVILSFLLMPILGCATPSEPGEPPAETKGPILFGSLTDLTGPAAATLAPIHFGTLDYFNKLNKEKGGINGHPVEVKWADTKYEIPAGITAYERMRDDGVILLTGMMTGTLTALAERLVKDNMPWSIPARNVSNFMWPPQEFFAYSPTDPDVGPVFLEWFWEEKLNKARPINVAAIYLDTPYGRSPLEGGLKAWIDSHPEIVDWPRPSLDFPIPPTTTDLTPELTKIKAANVDLIIHQVLKPQADPLMGGMIKLNMTMPIWFMGSQAGPTFIDASQKSPPGGQYSMETTPYVWEKDNACIKANKEIYDSIENPGADYGMEYLAGLIGARIMQEVATRALDTVGYDKLDGIAVHNAFEATKNFDPWPGGLPPMSWSTDDHRGITQTKIYFTTDGMPKPRMWPISDWYPVSKILPPGME